MCAPAAWEIISEITVNQQILAAIKFGVSQIKVIWRLLNLASLHGPSMKCTIDVYMLAATNISENTQFAKFAKYNSTPKFGDLQYQNWYICSEWPADDSYHTRVRELENISTLIKGKFCLFVYLSVCLSAWSHSNWDHTYSIRTNYTFWNQDDLRIENLSISFWPRGLISPVGEGLLTEWGKEGNEGVTKRSRGKAVIIHMESR